MTKIHPKTLEHLRQDKKLAVLIDNIPVVVVETPKNVLEQLLKSIVSQQLSTGAAETIYNRFLKLLKPELALHQAVNILSVEELRKAGLSYQKAQYLKNVAIFFESNNLLETTWDKMSDEEIINLLTQIKGVGVWTVQMLLMFTLYREDVFPIDDLIIRKSIVNLYEIESTDTKNLLKEVHFIADNWRPYRTIACRYLWAAKDTAYIKLN